MKEKLRAWIHRFRPPEGGVFGLTEKKPLGIPDDLYVISLIPALPALAVIIVYDEKFTGMIVAVVLAVVVGAWDLFKGWD